ncbi:hypothetical protein AGMMS50256_34580 [Betaproteobacteria bacterium]|nr:hypothetical protein AGMMS50256_34580 [Betaproteobacteria bacterium]
MPTNVLTDAKCKAARAGGKAVKVFDGGGMFLFISPTGAKTWRLAYRLGGKPQTMSLGAYPAVSLAEARAKREEMKEVLRNGCDPMAARRAGRQPKLTFSEACSRYWAGRRDVSESYRDNATRAIEMHLNPFLGKMDVGAVAREDQSGGADPAGEGVRKSESQAFRGAGPGGRAGVFATPGRRA